MDIFENLLIWSFLGFFFIVAYGRQRRAILRRREEIPYEKSSWLLELIANETHAHSQAWKKIKFCFALFCYSVEHDFCNVCQI